MYIRKRSINTGRPQTSTASQRRDTIQLFIPSRRLSKQRNGGGERRSRIPNFWNRKGQASKRAEQYTIPSSNYRRSINDRFFRRQKRQSSSQIYFINSTLNRLKLLSNPSLNIKYGFGEILVQNSYRVGEVKLQQQTIDGGIS